RCGEDRSSAVRQVVALHRSHHGVLQTHALDSHRDPLRLEDIEPVRKTGFNGTVSAGPGADPAEDHEGRGAIAPAFADVRAMRLFADGVEVEPAHQPLELDEVLASADADLEPIGTLYRSFVHADSFVVKRRSDCIPSLTPSRTAFPGRI